MNKKILLFLLMLIPLLASAQTKRTIHVATAGTLSDYISEEEKYQIEELTLTGELNGNDLGVLREMAGRGNRGFSDYYDIERSYIPDTQGILKVLDISEVKIISGGIYLCIETGMGDENFRVISDDEIPSYVFWGCHLVSIKLPQSLTKIDEHAFRGCPLTSIVIPNNVTSIGYNAFCCSGLTTIMSEIENPFAISDYVFYDYNATATLIVPPGKKSVYQNTAGWNKFKNIVEVGGIGYKFEANDICYRIGENNTVSVVWRKANYSGNIVIPESVEYNGEKYSVMSIGDHAFQGCNGLTTVIIPNSVTSIGHYAFENCKDLTSVTIPNSVTTIGASAFDGSGLESINIPSSVTSIGGGAFDQCRHLYAVHITDLEAWCQIEFADFDSNPLSYAHHLFLEGKEITFLEIPDGMTSIRDRVFPGCSALTSITIPNSVKSIGIGAFANCSGLTSITIPNSVTSIEEYAFYNCNALKNIQSIIEWPFKIDANVFSEETYTNVQLIVPKDKKWFYLSTEGWNKFQNIVEVGGVGYEFEADGIRYIIGENNTVSVVSRDEKYSGNVVIPSFVDYNGNSYNVTIIGNDAFFGCSELTSITIPNSITSIGEGAFGRCSDLTSITIPNSVTTINRFAFYFCSGLTTIIIPNSVTSIGESAFEGCSSLTSVTIPNSVTDIGLWAFADCRELKTVVSEIEVPFAINAAFSNTATATLIVPFGTKAAYQSTAGWNEFQNIVEVSEVGKEFEADGIRYKIGENNIVSVILKDQKYSGNIIIPSQVAYYGRNFDVTSIGSSAFEGCVELYSVSIPSSVVTIGNGAFYYCTGLTTMDIPNGVTTIGEGAFSKCAGLTSVTIPGSVTSIGINAFFQCYGLTQITSGIENPFAIDNGVFPTSVYNEASLIVPSGKKSAYQNTAGWKRFQKIYHADGIYTLIYYVDGEEYKSVKYSYGAEITPEAEPSKTGYTFSGWSDVPKTMPADDVAVTGTFTANKYYLTYKVDGEVYVTYELDYGTAITPEPAPTREGYTFSGWSYIPSTMPAEEVNVVGSFTINQYTITYMIDGEKYATDTVDFNSKIVPPTPPSKDGFDFAWEEYPETMPAHDITINGAYTTTGILSIAVESGKAKIFTLDGRQVDTPQKGINIIRMDDGTIKKVVLSK